MPYSVPDFAQLIRNKSNAYDDWDDFKLTDAILAKHSDYANWIDPAELDTDPDDETKKKVKKTVDTSSPRRVLKQAEIEDILRKVGWPEKEIPTMSATAMGESSGKPWAVNEKGEYSMGLFQINMDPKLKRNYDKQRLISDPVYNAQTALEIRRREGLNAWGAYRNGSYKKWFKGKPLPPTSYQPGGGGADQPGGASWNIPGLDPNKPFATITAGGQPGVPAEQGVGPYGTPEQVAEFEEFKKPGGGRLGQMAQGMAGEQIAQLQPPVPQTEGQAKIAAAQQIEQQQSAPPAVTQGGYVTSRQEPAPATGPAPPQGKAQDQPWYPRYEKFAGDRDLDPTNPLTFKAFQDYDQAEYEATPEYQPYKAWADKAGLDHTTPGAKEAYRRHVEKKRAEIEASPEWQKYKAWAGKGGLDPNKPETEATYNAYLKEEHAKKFKAQPWYPKLEAFAKEKGLDPMTREAVELYNKSLPKTQQRVQRPTEPERFEGRAAAGPETGVELTPVAGQDWRKTGVLETETGQKLKLAPARVLPEGKVAEFIDEKTGQKYFMGEDGQLGINPLSEDAKVYKVKLVPYTQRDTVQQEQAKSQYIHQLSAQVAADYNFNFNDVKEWFNTRRLFALEDTEAAFDPERFYQKKPAPGSQYSEASAVTEHHFTEKSLIDLTNFVEAKRANKESAVVELMAKGVLKPDITGPQLQALLKDRHMDLDLEKLGQNPMWNAALKKSEQAQIGLQNVITRLQQQDPNLSEQKARWLAMGQTGMIGKDVAAAEVAAYDETEGRLMGEARRIGELQRSAPSGRIGPWDKDVPRYEGPPEGAMQAEVRAALKLYEQKYGSLAAFVKQQHAAEAKQKAYNEQVSNDPFLTYMINAERTSRLEFIKSAARIGTGLMAGAVVWSKPAFDLLGQLTGAKDFFDTGRIQDHPLYKTSLEVDKNFGKALATDPAYASQFLSGDLPRALGSSAALMFPSMIGTRLGGALIGRAAIGIFSTLSMGGEDHKSAKEAGASDADAQRFALLDSGLFGWTEMLGFGKIFERLNQGPAKGIWRKAFMEALKESAEEGFLNEGPQTLGANYLASITYDPDRKWDAGLAGALGAAGVSASVVSMGVTALLGLRHRGRIRKIMQHDMANGGPFVRDFGEETGFYVHGKPVAETPELAPLFEQHRNQRKELEDGVQDLKAMQQRAKDSSPEEQTRFFRHIRDIEAELTAVQQRQKATAVEIAKLSGIPTPTLLDQKEQAEKEKADAVAADPAQPMPDRGPNQEYIEPPTYPLQPPTGQEPPTPPGGTAAAAPAAPEEPRKPGEFKVGDPITYKDPTYGLEPAGTIEAINEDGTMDIRATDGWLHRKAAAENIAPDPGRKALGWQPPVTEPGTPALGLPPAPDPNAKEYTVNNPKTGDIESGLTLKEAKAKADEYAKSRPGDEHTRVIPMAGTAAAELVDTEEDMTIYEARGGVMKHTVVDPKTGKKVTDIPLIETKIGDRTEGLQQPTAQASTALTNAGIRTSSSGFHEGGKFNRWQVIADKPEHPADYERLKELAKKAGLKVDKHGKDSITISLDPKVKSSHQKRAQNAFDKFAGLVEDNMGQEGGGVQLAANWRHSKLSALAYSLATRREEEGDVLDAEDLQRIFTVLDKRGDVTRLPLHFFTDPPIIGERGDFGWVKKNVMGHFMRPEFSHDLQELVKVVLGDDPIANDWATNGSDKMKRATITAVMDTLANAVGAERSSTMTAPQWERAVKEISGEGGVSASTREAMLGAGAATSLWHQNMLDFLDDLETKRLIEQAKKGVMPKPGAIHAAGAKYGADKQVIKTDEHGKVELDDDGNVIYIKDPNGLSKEVLVRTFTRFVQKQFASDHVRRSAERARKDSEKRGPSGGEGSGTQLSAIDEEEQTSRFTRLKTQIEDYIDRKMSENLPESMRAGRIQQRYQQRLLRRGIRISPEAARRRLYEGGPPLSLFEQQGQESDEIWTELNDISREYQNRAEEILFPKQGEGIDEYQQQPFTGLWDIFAPQNLTWGNTGAYRFPTFETVTSRLPDYQYEQIRPHLEQIKAIYDDWTKASIQARENYDARRQWVESDYAPQTEGMKRRPDYEYQRNLKPGEQPTLFEPAEGPRSPASEVHTRVMKEALDKVRDLIKNADLPSSARQMMDGHWLNWRHHLVDAKFVNEPSLMSAAFDKIWQRLSETARDQFSMDLRSQIQDVYDKAFQEWHVAALQEAEHKDWLEAEYKMGPKTSAYEPSKIETEDTAQFSGFDENDDPRAPRPDQVINILTPYTISVMPKIARLADKGGLIKLSAIRDFVTQTKGLSAGLRDLMTAAANTLETQGVTRPTEEEFRTAIALAALPLYTFTTDTEASTRFGVVGPSKSKRTGTETHLLNTSASLGETGHFYHDFPHGVPWNTGEVVDPRTGQTMYFAYRRGVGHTLEAAFDERIGIISSSKKEVHDWAYNRSAAFVGASVPQGLFGHDRAIYDKMKRVWLGEVQSDMFMASYNEGRMADVLLRFYNTNFGFEPLGRRAKRIAETIFDIRDKVKLLERKHGSGIANAVMKGPEAVKQFIAEDRKRINSTVRWAKLSTLILQEKQLIDRIESLIHSDIPLDRLPDETLIEVGKWMMYDAKEGNQLAKKYLPTEIADQLSQRIPAVWGKKTTLEKDLQAADSMLQRFARTEKAEHRALKTLLSSPEALSVMRMAENIPELKRQLIEASPTQMRQLVAHRQNYMSRILREAVRREALNGKKSLLIPTPHTMAIMADMIPEAGPASATTPYNVEEAEDDNELVTGDTISMNDGEVYRVVGLNPDSAGDFLAVPEGDIEQKTEQDYVDEQVKNKVDYVKQEATSLQQDFEILSAADLQDILRARMDVATGREEIAKALTKATAEDLVAYRQKLLNRARSRGHAAYAADSLIEELEATADSNYIVDPYRISLLAERSIRENSTEAMKIRFNNMLDAHEYHFTRKNDEGETVHYWSGNDEPISLMQPYARGRVTTKTASETELKRENFFPEDWTIIEKYIALNKQFMKDRTDVKQVTDDFGHKWLETQLTEADKGDVAVFSSAEDNLNRQNDIAASMIMAHSRRSTSLLAQAHDAKIGKDGLLELSPAGNELLYRAMSEAFKLANGSPKYGRFFGFHLGGAETEAVRVQLEKMVDFATDQGHKNTAEGLKQLLNTFEAATSPQYGNVTMVTDFGHGLNASMLTSRIEEQAHRAQYNALFDIGFPPFDNFKGVDAYNRAVNDLSKKGAYKNMSDIQLHNEIVGKIFRPDALTELSMTDQERSVIKNMFFTQLIDSGVTPADIIRHYEGVESEYAKEFVQTARDLERASAAAQEAERQAAGPPNAIQEDVEGRAPPGDRGVQPVREGPPSPDEAPPEAGPQEVEVEEPTRLTPEEAGEPRDLTEREDRADYMGWQQLLGRHEGPWGPRASEYKDFVSYQGKMLNEGDPDQQRWANAEMMAAREVAMVWHALNEPDINKAIETVRDSSQRQIQAIKTELDQSGAGLDPTLVGDMKEELVMEQGLLEAINKLDPKDFEYHAPTQEIEGPAFSGFEAPEPQTERTVFAQPTPEELQPAALQERATNDIAALMRSLRVAGLEEAASRSPEAPPKRTGEEGFFSTRLLYEGERDVTIYEAIVNLIRTGYLAGWSIVKTNLYGNTLNLVMEEMVRAVSLPIDLVRRGAARRGAPSLAGRLGMIEDQIQTILADETLTEKQRNKALDKQRRLHNHVQALYGSQALQRTVPTLAPLDIIAGLFGRTGALRAGLGLGEQGLLGALIEGVKPTEAHKTELAGPFVQEEEPGEEKRVYIRNFGVPALDMTIEAVKRLAVGIDRPFKAYASTSYARGARRMIAKNQVSEGLETNWREAMEKIGDTGLEKVIEGLAKEYAKMVTFQNPNVFTDFIGKGQAILLNPRMLKDIGGAAIAAHGATEHIGGALYVATGATLPFIRTPTNIGLRALEYTPVGLGLAVWSFHKIGNGYDRAVQVDDINKRRDKEDKLVKKMRASERNRVAGMSKIMKAEYAKVSKELAAAAKKIKASNMYTDAYKAKLLAKNQAAFDKWEAEFTKKQEAEQTKTNAAMREVNARYAEANASLQRLRAVEDSSIDVQYSILENQKFANTAARFGIGTTLGALTLMGVMRGLIEAVGHIGWGDDDEDEQKRKEEMQTAAIPNFSVQIGGRRYPYDKFPFGLAVGMGIDVLEQAQREGTNSERVTAALGKLFADVNALNPITDARFVQTDPFSVAGNYAKSVTPFLNLKINQELGNIFDPKQRTAFNKGFFAQFGQQMPFYPLREAMVPESKLPFGGEGYRGTTGERAAETFFNIPRSTVPQMRQSELPIIPLQSVKEEEKGGRPGRSTRRGRRSTR